jgi:flavodoxin
MKYEVAYVSNSGNTAALAKELAAMLPQGSVQVRDLAKGDELEEADVYCIGFGVNRGAVPIKIMNALDLLEGKTILLFVTCGMEPTEEYKAAIQHKLQPFLPDDCDYRGLFLCAGQFPDQALQSIRSALEAQPENEQAKSLLEHDKKTRGHPNAQDYAQLRDFLRQALGQP